MAWQLHPPVQSGLHPAEQTTEYQIKSIRQGNRLFSYLIGSWGLRTGFCKSGDTFTSISSLFVILVSAFICSAFAWEVFQCPDSLNESKMWVCWTSLCVVGVFIFSPGQHSIGHVTWFSLANKAHISLLWAITKSLSRCYRKKYFLLHEQLTPFYNLCVFFTNLVTEILIMLVWGVRCEPTVSSVGIWILYTTDLISLPEGVNRQDQVYNNPSLLQSTCSWIKKKWRSK